MAHLSKQEIQRQVDALAQQYIDRMRVAHIKRQAEIQAQIEECERQKEVCSKRLAELESRFGSTNPKKETT